MNKAPKKEMRFGAICQKREIGYSLHLSWLDLALYEEPEGCSSQKGGPYICFVDERTFSEIKKSKHGIFRADSNYPSEYSEGQKTEVSFYEMNIRTFYLRDEYENQMALGTIRMSKEELEEKYKDFD
jgi:hypothetical protein